MGDLVEEKLTASIIGPFFEVGVRVMYKGELLSNQRLDMVVDGRVIVDTGARTLIQALRGAAGT